MRQFERELATQTGADEELLRRFAATQDPAIREEIVRRHLNFARAMAARYQGKGEASEDLFQVACVGLVNAVDRFDPEKGSPFVAFAAPTILGELRRHFRDKAKTIRLPRGLQERSMRIESATESLESELGHPPNVAEIAAAADLEEDEVLEAIEASTSVRRVRSLESSVDAGSDEAETLGSRLGEVDSGYEQVDDWSTVAGLLHVLSEQERAALRLRLVEELSQSEIGKRIGCSQMQVSRILRRALSRLRDEYEGAEASETA